MCTRKGFKAQVRREVTSGQLSSVVLSSVPANISSSCSNVVLLMYVDKAH
jgi:hypothetical protein